MEWMIGIDVGGTFTDFHAFGPGGAAVVHKAPSTPDDPARAIVEGVGVLCRAHGIPMDSIARLAHGTTVATNALIQRRGGTVALVVTRGFRDLIEIGRQVRPKLYDMQLDQPTPLVPRARRFEMDERVRADGTVARAPSDAHLAALADTIIASGADAVAVCLLFAFLDPTHEQRLAKALRARRPGLPISLSSEVQPEFREYERLSTTVLNAFLQPVMSGYLDRLERGFAERTPGASLGINQSSGGLMSVRRAGAFPVRSALSGPAAGVMGAVEAARAASVEDVITLDMGGTSADVALIRGLAPAVAFERTIEGFPVRLPCLDINAVGAGGGSIAWFDRDGLMKVGPQSAGADPGPACYGRGGTAATVTDANLALGRLSPSGLLGGAMPLDLAAARAALALLAEHLGFTVERAAHGILGLVVSNMTRAIRAVSVERGIDPRGFALLAFGGAGPLHASAVARSLGMRRVIVPPSPGILCAQGLLASDLVESFVATVRLRLGSDLVITNHLAPLSVHADAWFALEGVEPADRTERASLDMRYVGQNFEIAVPAQAGDAATALQQRFFDLHDRAYGYHSESDPVEIVNVRLTATARLPRPGMGRHAPAEQKPPTRRMVHFAWDAPVEADVHQRASLHPGTRLAGPAVIEQMDATTLLFAGDTAHVAPNGTLIVEVGP